MWPFDRFWAWWSEDPNQADEPAWFSQQPLPPVAFQRISEVVAPPPNDAIAPAAFYVVARGDHPMWALFACPCGCEEVVTLSLQPAHRPRWLVRQSVEARPSLYPSIWRDTGCMSHFWIDDGRVYWCQNTGYAPRREP